jgi:uncharacterized membrane protein
LYGYDSGITRELAPLARSRSVEQSCRMPTILLCALVFVSAMIIDFAETRYVCAVTRRDAHAAALWSLTMYAIGALGFVAVINVSLWLMVPEALGFYCGTRIALSDCLHVPKAVARYLHGSSPTDRSR